MITQKEIQVCDYEKSEWMLYSRDHWFPTVVFISSRVREPLVFRGGKHIMIVFISLLQLGMAMQLISRSKGYGQKWCVCHFWIISLKGMGCHSTSLYSFSVCSNMVVVVSQLEP